MLRQGHPGGGAGAVVWGGINPDGQRDIIASVSVALLDVHDVGVAEAWGLHYGIQAAMNVPTRWSSALISGDNLAVIRYGAGQGRTTNPDIQGSLDGSLFRLASSCRRVSWQVVPRNHNLAAHRLASLGASRTIDALRPGGPPGTGSNRPRHLLVGAAPSSARPGAQGG